MLVRVRTDPDYSQRLLADGNAAAAELGFAMPGYRLKVVANRPGRHNMVVCTLCSCYPVSLPGPSPSWCHRARTAWPGRSSRHWCPGTD